MTDALMIPVHNALPKLRQCLASLSEWAGIHIYDDASEEETRDYCAGLHDIYHLRNEEPRGYAHHLNTLALWCLSRGIPVAVVCNSDTIVAPQARELMVGTLLRELDGWDGNGDPPGALFVGPALSYAKSGQGEDPDLKAIDPEKSIPAQLGKIEAARANSVSQGLGLLVARTMGRVRMPTVNGACFAFSTRAWAVYGPFDERFGRGSAEEDEWMRRVNDLSGRPRGLYVPAACVYQWGRSSFGAVQDLDTKALWRRNRDELHRKEGGESMPDHALMGHPREWPEFRP
jgi:GT2 family glycosyltransferase